MGLILVIAFLATLGFYRRAKQIGIHPGKAASIPFIGAGMLLVFAFTIAFVAGRILVYADVSHRALSWIGTAFDWLLILSYGYYIKRNWDILSRSNVTER